MNPNQSTDETQIDIAELLQSFSAVSSELDTDNNQIDINNAVGSILLNAVYGNIPPAAADVVPGLEIFEDSDNPGDWFWEWEWGECQDGPYKNQLETLIAFAKFAAELAIELEDEAQ
ncbi:MAG: hypothetical protein ACFB14_13460 [Leptolyngbyaceae cyanobacterium]